MQAIGVPLEDTRKLTRLWAHETLRVFHDRLVSDEDRTWFQSLLKVRGKERMGEGQRRAGQRVLLEGERENQSCVGLSPALGTSPPSFLQSPSPALFSCPGHGEQAPGPQV